ncbi:type VI secretion system, baseplate protein [Halarcobacter ebronensis]|nr:type VI secretion system, baseplate protein [Halarcobacter ebronensis]
MMQNRVVWREGLFLRPQHFQQNDRHVNYQLMTRTIQSKPNSWGLYNLSIDENLLNTGKISIKSISGILPDGTLFDINSKNQQLSLDIKINDANKIVYLVLPAFIQDSDEVHFEEQKNLLTRYSAKVINNVPNTNSGESSISDILIAQQNFKLVTQDGINDNYIKMEILKVGNVLTSGVVSLDENFSATFLHFNNCEGLVSKTKELLSMISYRAERLADTLSDTTLQATELGNYLMLQLLNKAEARLNYFLTQDKVHPDSLFLELITLSGELSVFMKKEKRLSAQIVYNHNEQYSSFIRVFDEIKSMLSMVLEQNSISLPVEKRKYGIYIALIKDKNLIKNSTFIFSVSADVPAQKIKEVLLNSLKLGTIETIKKLVNFHLVGFKIRALSTPPKEIPFKVNHLYFSIELTKENKDELLKSTGFAFYLSSELSNVDYSIWAIKDN